MARFQKPRRVLLKTFHGSESLCGEVDSAEYYWLLIGCAGEVVSEERRTHPAYPDMGERVQVVFDADIGALGLHSHNTTNDSLWIFLSDLEVM
jgi:hypothetical protein